MLAPPPPHARAGRSSGSASSTGSAKDMASVEPGASEATPRSVAVIASLVRYMLTPVEATTAGLFASKSASSSRPHHVSPASKSTPHEPQERPDAEAEVDKALALPCLRTGSIDLEHE